MASSVTQRRYSKNRFLPNTENDKPKSVNNRTRSGIYKFPAWMGERMQLLLLISAAWILIASVSGTRSAGISCGAPPEIQFASVSDVTDEEHAVGTTVTYTCEFGFTTKGESRTVECELSDNKQAQWSEPKFSCHPQSCGDPGYIYNGRRIGSLFTFPNSVRYECELGYKLVGLSTRYCQTSGSWSGKLPVCEVVTCSPPKSPDNGHVTYSSLEYGSELKYKCDKGFLLNINEAIFCDSKGSWSKTGVKCIESSCDVPLEPEHGSMQLGSSSGKPRAGSIVIFTCHGDTIPDGPVTTKCLENGQWTFPTPKCLEPCSIPDISDGVIGKYERRYYKTTFKKIQTGSRVEENEQLFLNCSEGYEVIGSMESQEKVSCRQGKWSRELSCIPAFCRKLPPPAEKAEIVSLSPEHGGRVSYQCFPDYRKIKEETVSCDLGTWKGNPPTCKSTRCPELEFPGLLEGPKSYRDGEVFEIKCDSRYRVAAPGLLRCEDGKWIGPLPPCTAASCKEPPPKLNLARAVVSSMTHGSLVKYVCENPYILVGSSSVQCLFGKWEGRFPRCEDSRCYLKNLGSSLHVSEETPNVTYSGEQLMVICKEGYSARWDAPLCLNGKWSGDSVSPCKENVCSVPLLYHGDVLEEKLGDYYLKWFRYVQDVTYIKIPSGTVASPGTTYILSCNNGYSFQGTTIGRRGITCTKGRWIPHPVCLRVGAIYVPPTSTRRPQQRIPFTQSQRGTSTAVVKTTKISTTSTTVIMSTMRESLEVESDEVTSTIQPTTVAEDCLCVHSVDDENLVASVDEKPLNFRDSVPDGSTVVFRCKYVGFHRFNGPREIRCENCGRWQTTAFPTCTDPKRGNAIILFENNLNISAEGILEARRGQSVQLTCIAIERAVYPQWTTPTHDRISIIQERKERKTYGDILYVSHLQIKDADFEHGGSYECTVENNTVTVVQLTVNDPDALCPNLQEEEGISFSYEKGRRVKSKALFSCTNRGQELSGKAVLTCLGNGQWSDPPPRCQDIKCKELKVSDMLQIHYPNDREIGSLATFHCQSPAKRSGVPFARCLENGSWSDPTPTCKTPPCAVGDLFSGLPPNVVPDIIYVTNNTLPYSTKIRMTCEGDLIVVGYPEAECGKNGTWEVPSIQCVSGCPVLGKPPEGKLIIKPEKGIFKLGEIITFSCPPGMNLNTESQLIMCLKNGWSESILPDCTESEDYEYEAQSTEQSDFS